MKKNVNNEKIDHEQYIFHNPNNLILYFKKHENNNTIMSYEYYLKILEKSWKLVQENKIEIAINYIQEELETSYLPSKMENYFNIMIKLIRNYGYEKRNEEIKNLNATSLIQILLKDFPKNLGIFDYLTTKTLGFFSKDDLDHFRFIFTSEKYSNNLKFECIFLLNEIIDFNNEKIKFINSNTKQTIELKLGTELVSKKLDAFYEKTYKAINDLIFQNPSLEEMANSLVDKIVIYYWPFLPNNNINPEHLGKYIVNYLYYSINNKTKKIDKNNPIINLICKVLEEQC